MKIDRLSLKVLLSINFEQHKYKENFVLLGFKIKSQQHHQIVSLQNKYLQYT